MRTTYRPVVGSRRSAVRALDTGSWLLSLAVLTAGVYDVAAGLRAEQGRLAVSAAALALLGALDVLDGRLGRRSDRRDVAVALLLARAALVEVAVVFDVSRTAALLRLLVVVRAQLVLGEAAARAAVGCYAAALVALVTAGTTVTPGAAGGWADPRTVSSVVMFLAGLVLALVVAGLLSRLDAARQSAQELVDRLAGAQLQVAQQAAAAERGRIARDIHDDLGHHLTVVTVQLGKAEVFLDRDPAVARRAVRDAQDAGRRALAEVRRSVGNVRGDDRFDLRAALAGVATLPGHAGPHVRLDVVGGELGLPETVLLATFRVVQEALTNARRHSSARLVDVLVRLDRERGVSVRVADDGRGFPTGSVSGHGLLGMRERVELLGGSLTVDSAAGRGTVVHARLPAAEVAVP